MANPASAPTSFLDDSGVKSFGDAIVPSEQVHFITLNKDNYMPWISQVSVVLSGNSLIDYVEGKESRPTNIGIVTRRDVAFYPPGGRFIYLSGSLVRPCFPCFLRPQR